jgi:hypothetical protein
VFHGVSLLAAVSLASRCAVMKGAAAAEGRSPICRDGPTVEAPVATSEAAT